MAGLATGGFALSALPRAPDIPANVGVLDVKGIYDRTVQGMQTNEAMRTALARQMATDEALKAQRVEALAQQQVIPAQAASQIATANRTTALASPQIVGQEVAKTATGLDADLAAEQNRRDNTKFLSSLSAPQRLVLAAKGPETNTTGSSILGPNGNVHSTTSETATVGGVVVPVSSQTQDSPYALMKGVPGEIRTFEQLTAGLSPEEKEVARRIHLGMTGRASSAGAQTIEVKQPDGSIQRFTFDPRTGGYYLPSVGGSALAAPAAAAPAAAPVIPGAAPAAAPVVPGAAPAAPAPVAAAPAPSFRGQSTVDAQRDKTKASEEEKLKVEKQAALPKAQQTIRDWDTNAANVINTLQDVSAALDTFGGASSGIKRKVAARVPGTDEYNIVHAIDTALANVAFDKLAAMRATSRTGGALGNVTDNDMRLLQKSIASLDLGQDLPVLKKNIEKVVSRYEQMNQSQHQAFEQEFKDLLQPAQAAAPAAHPQDSEAVAWAKANPQDHRSAAILKANGL